MWFSMSVLYIMLGLSVVALFFLESSPLFNVIGIVCALVGSYLVTLIVISWWKQERTLRTQARTPMLSIAPPKTRLHFRIAGVMIGIAMLASGCFFLAMLMINWAETLKNPVDSLVFAVMGLCGVFNGLLFGYCCLAAKEWPSRANRN